MANAIVNTAKKKLLDGDIDLVNDTIKCMLLTTSHTTNIDTQEFIDDVSTNEVSASGTYSAGGAALTSKAVTVDDTNDRAYFDAADLAFTSATISAQYAAIYKDTGTPGTSPIIGIIDFGSEKTSTDDTFTITFTAPGSGGVLYLS